MDLGLLYSSLDLLIAPHILRPRSFSKTDASVLGHCQTRYGLGTCSLDHCKAMFASSKIL